MPSLYFRLYKQYSAAAVWSDLIKPLCIPVSRSLYSQWDSTLADCSTDDAQLSSKLVTTRESTKCMLGDVIYSITLQLPTTHVIRRCRVVYINQAFFFHTNNSLESVLHCYKSLCQFFCLWSFSIKQDWLRLNCPNWRQHTGRCKPLFLLRCWGCSSWIWCTTLPCSINSWIICLIIALGPFVTVRAAQCCGLQTCTAMLLMTVCLHSSNYCARSIVTAVISPTVLQLPDNITRSKRCADCKLSDMAKTNTRLLHQQ